MVTIINGFRQRSPIAAAVKNASDAFFGDRLTPALRQAQLDKTQQDMALQEREANASRAFAEGMGDPLLGNAALGGFKGQDTADFNRLLAARRAAEGGGDLLGNLDLNAAMLGAGQSASSTGLGMREGHANDFRRTKYSSDASAAASRYGADRRASTAMSIAEANRAAAAEAAGNELVEAVDQNGNTVFVPRRQVDFRHSPVVSTDERVSGTLSPRLRDTPIPELSLEERAIIGAAPSTTEAEGDLRLRNFNRADDLSLRQAEGAGLAPSETQVRGSILERAMDETGFDLSTLPEGAVAEALGFGAPDAPAVKRFADPRGNAYISTDNGLTDARTGEEIPADAVEMKGVSATDRTGAGLAPTATTATAAFGEAAALRDFNDLISITRNVAESDPTIFGASGAARDAVRGAGNVARSLDSLLGGEGAFEQSLNEAQRELGSASPETQRALSGAFDPNLDAIDRLGNLLAFQAASTIAKQEGRGLSDNDFKRFREIIGDPKALFSDQASFLNGIKLLEDIVSRRVVANEERIGGQFNGASPGGLPRISSDADYDALPPGAQYVDPEGNVRRKQ